MPQSIMYLAYRNNDCAPSMAHHILAARIALKGEIPRQSSAMEGE